MTGNDQISHPFILDYNPKHRLIIIGQYSQRVWTLDYTISTGKFAYNFICATYYVANIGGSSFAFTQSLSQWNCLADSYFRELAKARMWAVPPGRQPWDNWHGREDQERGGREPPCPALLLYTGSIPTNVQLAISAESFLMENMFSSMNTKMYNILESACVPKESEWVLKKFKSLCTNSCNSSRLTLSRAF